MKKNHIIGLGLAIVVLLLMTAGASALITRNSLESETKATEKVVAAKPIHHKSQIASQQTIHKNNQQAVHKENIHWNEKIAAQPVAVAKPVQNCTDYNVVGLALGAAAGGLAGNQIGKGGGNTAATIGGALGGAYLGKEYIPTQNALCPK